jgi:hypothetical protein
LEKDRVPLFSIANSLTRRATLLLAAAVLSGAAFRTVFAGRPDGQPDEPTSDSVGVIDGEAISVTGPMSMDVTGGQVRTVLRSGSDVRVKSGNARIDLVEGGEISICGPAHLSVLKSGASLTVALESGTIHAHIEHEPALMIYTAQIQAHTITVGDGPQDVLVGFDSAGAMCLRANRGAIRLEQQLSGQSVIIPQTGDVLLANGQFENLRSGAGHCTCELQPAKPAPPPEISQIATAEEVRKNSLNVKDDAPPAAAEKPATEEPIYQVFMPPLIYDAKAKVQPEVDPRMIILVRRVRVRPSLIFQGRVQGETAAAAAKPPPSSAGVASANPPKPSAPANDSFVGRVRSFVRKLWSSGT